MSYKSQWSKDEESQLFTLQSAHGNRWASIAKHFNNQRNVTAIKNKFYSTLRKGHRKLNDYIKNIKKKEDQYKYRALKPIQQIFITKLGSVVDNKYDAKYEVKETALKLANNIQFRLINMALDDHEYDKRQKQTYETQEKLLQDILTFNKSCKKRKGKKKEQKLCKKGSQRSVERQERGREQKEAFPLYQSEMIEQDQQQENEKGKEYKIEAIQKNSQNNDSMKMPFFLSIKKLQSKQVTHLQEFQSKNISFLYDEGSKIEFNYENMRKSNNLSNRSYNWLLSSTSNVKQKDRPFQSLTMPTPAGIHGLSNFNNYSISSFINPNQTDEKLIQAEWFVTSSILKDEMNESNNVQKNHFLKTRQTMHTSMQSEKTLNNMNKSITFLNSQYSFIPHHKTSMDVKGEKDLKSNDKGKSGIQEK